MGLHVRKFGMTGWFNPVRGLSLMLMACLLSIATQWQAQAKDGAEKRIALVIGNAKYKDSPLTNPVNDAKDMSAALRAVGFQVIERTDASQKEMNRAITQFGEKLNADTVALFYYAGHGVQVKGKNYLVPVDAEITGESSIRAETVDVDAVLDQLSASDLNVVILDACRNNPFERRFRSISGGLAQMDAPKGSLIAYATAPGKTAIDGSGRNGIYTQELLRQIRTPGLPLEAVLKNVRRSVARATNDQQIPWESSSLTGDFYFNPGVGPVPATTAKPGADAPRPADAKPSAVDSPSPPVGATFQLSADEELWKAATQANTVTGYEAYLAEFPSGRYSSAAKLRINSLQRANALVAKPPLSESVTPASSERPVAARNETIDLGVTASATASPASNRLASGSSHKPIDDSATGATSTQKANLAKLSPAQDVAPQTAPEKSVAAPSKEDLQKEVEEAAARAAERAAKFKDRTFSKDLAIDPKTNMPFGNGQIFWLNGEKYEGEVKDGEPSGQGVYTSKNGNIYSGTWLNGRRHGKGRLTWPNGDYWEGEFRDDQQNLTGQMNMKRGAATITGVFTMAPDTGVLSGNGRLVWTNGDVFEGTLVRGVSQGKGSFTWANGQRYEGDWERDLPNGKGTISFSNGDRYVGEVRDGVQQGHGTYTLKDGDSYTGAWVAGNKHGQGRLTWRNGDYWEGQFKDNQQTEEGRMVTASSSTSAR